MSKRKREPVTIDVHPDELHREPPRGNPAKAHAPIEQPLPPEVRRVQRPIQRAAPFTAKEMRELKRLGRLAQQPDFWVGVFIRSIWR